MSRFTSRAAAVALTAAAAAAAALLAAFHPPLQAQADPSLTDVPLPRLQSMVLHCDLHPGAGDGSFTTAFCASATDELRERAFGGDPQGLAGWLREQRARLEVEEASSDEDPAATSAPPPLKPEQLKSVFLECDRLSRATVLDFGTAAQCSVVYEELKHRVFDGDSDRLLGWWRNEPRAAAGPGALVSQ